jgi:glucose/arabinose dehydrogenase
MHYFIWILLIISACNSSTSKNVGKKEPSIPDAGGLPLDKIKLPPGFKIEVYANDLPNARSMDLSPSGTLFVGTRDEGDVYAVKDQNGDYKADKKWIIAEGLNQPNGVALKDGDLYLAEISRIWKFPQIEENLENPEKEIFVDDYPDKEHHGWKYIAFGPDGNLYVPVGAPCNICESEDEIFATITRINMNTKQKEIVQRGIRNTVGFTWHPQTHEMWFTDNGGDRMGDDIPACELNYAPKDGMHFGFPYCHQGDLPDPQLGKKRSCDEFTPPAQKLGPHVAPLGIEFYTGNAFPEKYHNQIFIAEHGSWDRSVPIGYRVMMVRLEGNKPVSYEPFAEGWLQDGNAWGRPVDIEIMQDGSMLVSDDKAGVVYRISYSEK